MIGYTTVGSNDLPKAKAFYSELLGEMGCSALMDLGRIVLFGKAQGQPMFAVCTPFNGQPATVGNGNMVALAPGSRAAVDNLYAKAMSLGAASEGEPGERMPGFYGGYVRDLEGNKLAFVHIG
ncbi:Glyoxalase [Pseudomonas marincola]|uniref:Glyoxalase n=1 Tax=Pseudomonas marincola TaxID=437900 RepID=A0A653E269_9PSED|nr:VOC family protein [Pseudomonas marincola]CAE6954212.1 Glyoxalase [Pseudomonas marincola]